MRYLTEDDFKIAESNGINYNVAYSRFYLYEWTREDAITKPIKKKGSLWPSYRELATKHGISQHTFYDRIKRQNMTHEEAATAPLVLSQQRFKRREKGWV